MDKIKRAELTKVINTKLWAKRAEHKKKEGELSLIEQMEQEGLGIADLIARSSQKKTAIVP
jgi:hypothetical protein